MSSPTAQVGLTPSEIEDLNRKLSNLRHNINNHLSLIVAAVELIRRKPETAPRMIETLSEQPQKIIDELRKFSDEFERICQIDPPSLA